MNDTAAGFNVGNFLNAPLTEPNTRRPPIPAGTAVIGIFGNVPAEPRRVEGKDDPSKVYFFLEIPVEVDLNQNPTLKEHVGQEKVNLRYSFSLDFTPTGQLDMSKGKNVGLRQLREALDLNKPGDTFSFAMVPGRPVLCKIKNRSGEGGEVYDEVGSIARPR